ncbi:TonB-dependent receptor [Halieaceae bacterium]|nr:TonB-dependent receptor [Halieaceae bacterium]
MLKNLKKPISQAVSLSVLLGLTASPLVQAAGVALEEVIITAQKREENLQESPIAVTAFGAQDLEEMGATDISQIADFTPNVTIPSSIGYSSNPQINIRGAVTPSNNLSRDSSTGIYLDGVPISKTTGGIFDAVDLERIEVLRGPQGTLYGKNSIGGALNLISTKPSGELGMKVKAGLGNEGLNEFRTSIDLPAVGSVNDGLGELSSRVSYFRRQRDGFFKNDGTSSSDFDNRDQWGARVALRLDVTDDFTAEYSYDTYKMDQNPTMLALIDPSGQGASDNDRPDSISNNSADYQWLNVDGHALTLTQNINDTALGDITLKYIGANRKMENDSASDFDGTSSDQFRFINASKFEQDTHEFQISGTSENLKWVAGVFYSDASWATDNPRWIFQFGGNNIDIDQRSSDEESSAVFGQMTWTPDAFDGRLDLTAGVRYTKEERESGRRRVDISVFAGDTTPENAGVYRRDAGRNAVDAAGNITLDSNEVVGITRKEDWSETTPMFVASWQHSEDLNFYGKIVTGFRSGGFNGVANEEAQFEVPFNPETMTTYELGMKSRWADNSVQVNLAIFQNDYDDLQVNNFVPDALGIIIANAATATMRGAEVEVIAKPTANWDLAFNAAFLDTEYDEYTDTAADGVTIIDLSKTFEFQHSPESQYSGSAKYTFDPMDAGVLSVRVDYSWTDDQFVRPAPQDSLNVESYGIWNARVTLSEMSVGNGSMMLSAWGKNLADEEYWINAIALSPAAWNTAQWADPRSYGVELSYEF